MEGLLKELADVQEALQRVETAVKDTPAFEPITTACQSVIRAVSIVQSASENLTVSLLSEDQYEYDLATGEGMPEPTHDMYD